MDSDQGLGFWRFLNVSVGIKIFFQLDSEVRFFMDSNRCRPMQIRFYKDDIFLGLLINVNFLKRLFQL